MSPNIIKESTFLIHSIFMGLIISFVYDWLVIFRKLIKHSFAMISIQDVLFWAICAFYFFVLLGRENDGILRWFSVAGFGLGMLLYHATLGKYFSDIMSTYIKKCVLFLLRILHLVCRPIWWLIQRIWGIFRALLQKIHKFNIYVKKQLTVSIKNLKITLCKHNKKERSQKNGKIFYKKTKTE